ncbi:MAG: hypothetical protein QOD29_3089 [Alphaproteobacteria bacterium]|jgi:hypothetical protein|nr:hypothetical protein [Alphaproteobacteria bacterium]
MMSVHMLFGKGRTLVSRGLKFVGQRRHILLDTSAARRLSVGLLTVVLLIVVFAGFLSEANLAGVALMYPRYP